MAEDAVIMEGYLQKKKSKGIKGIRGWHDVYVLLTSHSLSYYRKRDEGKNNAKQQLVKLVDVESIKYLKDEDLRRFDVRLHKDMKVLSFRSLTNDVKGTMYAQKWAEKLEEVTEKYHAAPEFRGQAKKDDGMGNLTRLQQFFFKHKSKLPADASRDLRKRELNELIGEFGTDVSILRSLLETVLADNGDYDYDDTCDDYIEPGNKVDQEQSTPFGERVAPKHVQISDSIRRRRKRINDGGGQGSYNDGQSSISANRTREGHELSPDKSLSDSDVTGPGSPRSRGTTQSSRSADRPDWIKKNIQATAATAALTSVKSESGGFDDWDEPHRNPLVNMLRSKDFVRVLTDVFSTDDPPAHSLALRVLWLVFRGIYAPLELMFQFAAFIQVNCSGRRFTTPVHRAFMTILLSDNVASQLIFDEDYWPADRRLRDMYEQVQQKKAKEEAHRLGKGHDDDIDDRFKSAWNDREKRAAHCTPNHIDLIVRHHEAWPALFAALRGSPLQTRIRALMDINDIINNSYHNAMSLWRCGGGEGFADPLTAGFHSGGPGSWKKPVAGENHGLLGKLFGRKGTNSELKSAGGGVDHHHHAAGALHSSEGASSINSNASSGGGGGGGGDGELNYSQWQMWVWPMLADLPDGDSEDLCRILHVLIVGVFTAVHLQFFVHSKNFYHVLTSSLDSLRLFSGFNHESQLAANSVFCALVSILQDIYHVVFNTQVVHNKSWYNLFELTSAVRKFVFTTAYWNDPAIFSTNTAHRQAAHRTLSHRLTQRKADKIKNRAQSRPETRLDDDDLAHVTINSSGTLTKATYMDIQNAKSLFTYVAIETDHGVHFTFEGHAADFELTTNLGRLFHTLLQRCKDDDTTIHIKPPASEKYKALLVLLEQEGRYWRDARTILDLLYLDMLHRHKNFKLKKLAPFIVRFVSPWYAKGKHKIPEENESARRAVIKDLRAALFDLTSNFDYTDQKLFSKILQLGSVSQAIPPTVSGVGDPYQFAPSEFVSDYKSSLVHQSLIGADLDVGAHAQPQAPPSPAGSMGGATSSPAGRMMAAAEQEFAHKAPADEEEDMTPPPPMSPLTPAPIVKSSNLFNSFFTPPDESDLLKPPTSYSYTPNPPKRVAETPQNTPLPSSFSNQAQAAPPSPRATSAPRQSPASPKRLSNSAPQTQPPASARPTSPGVAVSGRLSNASQAAQQPAVVRPSSPGGGGGGAARPAGRLSNAAQQPQQPAAVRPSSPGGGGGMMMSPQQMKHMASQQPPQSQQSQQRNSASVPASEPPPPPRAPPPLSNPQQHRSRHDDDEEEEVDTSKPTRKKSVHFSPEFSREESVDIDEKRFEITGGLKVPDTHVQRWSTDESGPPPPPPTWNESKTPTTNTAAHTPNRPAPIALPGMMMPAPPKSPPPPEAFLPGGARSPAKARATSPSPRGSENVPKQRPSESSVASPTKQRPDNNVVSPTKQRTTSSHAPANHPAKSEPPTPPAAPPAADDDDSAMPDPPPLPPTQAARTSSAQAPFTAFKASDPINAWCEDNRFSQYLDGLKSLGAEVLSDLVILTSKDLDSIDMKMLHKRRFLAAIEELNEDLNKQK